MRAVPKLYIRRGCPWCREARAFFVSHGVELELVDVDRNHGNLARMIEISGQSKTPTFEFEDFIVADFSVDELLDQLRERPDIQSRLGIAGEDPMG